MSLITNKHERVRFMKFAFVGLTGTVVDFGILNLLRLLFNMPLVWAQAISFVSAVINNFLWNRFWTYPESRSKGAPKQLIQFFLISIVGLMIRTPLIPWVDTLIYSFLESVQISLPLAIVVVSQNLALASSILVITFWNFFANRYWTYGNVSTKKEPSQTQDHKTT
jgi:putative flippase GtrA